MDHFLEDARERSEGCWVGMPEATCCGADKDARGGHSEAAVRPIRESQNTQPLGVRFRAMLGEEPKVELALV
jgi:hypothetical protein